MIDQVKGLEREVVEKVICDVEKEEVKLLREEFGVEYSQSRLSKILKSMKMTYEKSYQKGYTKPQTHTINLRNTLSEHFFGM